MPEWSVSITPSDARDKEKSGLGPFDIWALLKVTEHDWNVVHMLKRVPAWLAHWSEEGSTLHVFNISVGFELEMML